MVIKKNRNSIFEEEVEQRKGNLRGYVEPEHDHYIPYDIEEYHTTISPSEFNTFIEGSYSSNEKAQELAKKINYSLDTELSTNEHKVFIDDADNDVIVSYTGTMKASDYVTDLLLANGLGEYTYRFENSQKVLDKVRSKYAQSHVMSIGHSLGGSLAEYVTADRKITLNKGSSIYDVNKVIPKNQIDIRNRGDYVSYLSQYQKGSKERILIDDKKTGLFDSHDSRNILGVDRRRL